MSKEKDSKGSEAPKSGTKSIQDFGKDEIVNLNISDYTKPAAPPPKPENNKNQNKED